MSEPRGPEPPALQRPRRHMTIPRRARRRTLPRDPGAVALARRAVEEDDGALSGEELEVAKLLVSELVTNAVRHGAGEHVTLVMRLDGGRARYEVHDAGAQRPRRREPAGAEGGFGLNLVASLASRWGSDPDAGVWFELDRAGEHRTRGVEESAGPLESTRSAPFSALGAAVMAVLAALDLALGQSVLLIALLVLPALVCALVARWGDTAVVAALGVV